jgi:GTP-binding protein
LKITAEFVTSAARGTDFPRDGLPEIALVGRSNVGKSSLINALTRHRIARTSAAPGKTRLANIYRVQAGAIGPLYLVDLPGYGYARGGSADFERLVGEYFGRACGHADSSGREASASRGGVPRKGKECRNALLLVDARHPGLDSDRSAWGWLKSTAGRCAIAATKIDKLTRGERIRALRELESVFDEPVLPISAVTGEGLDELWKLIDNLATSSSRRRSSSPGGTARPPRTNKKR